MPLIALITIVIFIYSGLWIILASLCYYLGLEHYVAVGFWGTLLMLWFRTKIVGKSS